MNASQIIPADRRGEEQADAAPRRGFDARFLLDYFFQ